MKVISINKDTGISVEGTLREAILETGKILDVVISQGVLLGIKEEDIINLIMSSAGECKADRESKLLKEEIKND